MKRILSAFLFLIIAFAVQNCMTDSKDDNGKPDGGDTLSSDGTRMPKVPVVHIRTRDSLVFIEILASKEGEEDNIWIYRDGKLLVQPDFRGKSQEGHFSYQLVDSVSAVGVYTYYARYGTHKDSLSGKSKDYRFDYQGHSRSGRIALALDQGGQVSISLHIPNDEVFAGAAFERKIGADGKVIALDTVPMSGFSGFGYVDTEFVAEDASLYYRAVGLDAISETWLDPTPWDSIPVKNKIWRYVPSAAIRNLGTHVRATIGNPFIRAGATRFYLYRNTGESRSGSVRVDSAISEHVSVELSLQDAPDKQGAYVYWVEAVDPAGRTSARSALKSVAYTGNPAGPEITGLSTLSTAIHLSLPYGLDFEALIIERAKDTADKAVQVDTVRVPMSNATAMDLPPAGGYWYYRLVSILSGGEISDPGPWRRSEYFRFAPVYSSFTVPISNRGNRVEATVEKSPDVYHILYRSKFAIGADSIGVDTLRYADPGNHLADTPEKGAWYYRVQRFHLSTYNAGTVYRSELVRVDFTGNPVGPAISSLNVQGTFIGVSISADPDAIAYILERSQTLEKDWEAFDTLSAPEGFQGTTMNDRPPKAGYWYYRARSIRNGLTVTEPGTARRTPTEWTYGATFLDNLSATITNMGARVESQSYPSQEYVTYLVRGESAEYGKPVLVDSMRWPGSGGFLRDVPPKGTHYYWLQRVYVSGYPISSIHRSQPRRIEFTGSPEIGSLAKVMSGVRITFPTLATNDSLQIWRSSGDKPEDLGSYSLLVTMWAGAFSSYTVDETVDKTSARFYHYRLASVVEGKATALGSVKSIYYQPD